MLSITLLFSACKEKDIALAPSDCLANLKKLYNKELKCTEKNKIEVNLYNGIYDGALVHFPMIICSSCDYMPPKEGHTCDNKKNSV